jgi:hypothetical protein
MSNLVVSRFSWVRSPSAWRQTEAWRARQQEVRDNFEAAHSAANTSLYSASLNLVTGLGTIAAKIANQRVQAQAVARVLNKLA